MQQRKPVSVTRASAPLLRALVTLTLFAGVAWAAACEGGMGTPAQGFSPELPASVASVVVSPAAVTLNGVGLQQQFTAAAFDSSGQTIPAQSFTWSVSDTAVAIVDANGIVTAVSNGFATLFAVTGGVQGTAGVTVTPP